MKKHLYKILAGVLIGTSVFSMTACSSSEGNSALEKGESNKDIPMGRYMEESLELPSELQRIINWVPLEDGSIQVYGYNKEHKLISYKLTDTGSWETQEVSWSGQLGEYEANISSIDVGTDGTTYIMYTDKEYAYHVAKVTQEDTVEEIPIEWGDINGYPMQIEVLPDGDILIGRQGIGVTRFDGVEGNVITQYDGIEGEFSVNDNKLLQVDLQTDAQRGGVLVFDLDTGEELEVVSYEAKSWGNKVLAGEDGSTYVINTNGISRLAPGGSIWENIIEGTISAFGVPSLYVRDIVMKSPEEFLALFSSQEGGYEIIRYTYNADVPSRPTTEVSIYMLEENMTIRQAVAEYQRSNPEVFVNLQIGMGSGDGVTKADAIRTLNTELLAGKGPDLMVLDGLPIQSYIEKGVLMDMGDWANAKITEGEWLESIAKAYEEDGKIYALPTKFQLPTIWGNPDIINTANTLEDIASWAEDHPDKQVFYNMTPQQLIEKFYGITAGQWLDETGKIKEKEFMTFLESIKTLADLEVAPPKVGEEGLEDMKSLEYLAYNDTELHLETVKGFIQLTTPYSAIMQRDMGTFNLAVSGGQNVFDPVGIIGINSNTQYPDITKDIVDLALSSKVQDVSLLDGFPVNTKSFKKQQNDKTGAVMMMMANGGRPIDIVEVTQETIDQLAEYAKMAKVPAMTDEILMQMIIEETKGYFDGEKTASEAAAAVAQRTQAYLAE